MDFLILITGIAFIARAPVIPHFVAAIENQDSVDAHEGVPAEGRSQNRCREDRQAVRGIGRTVEDDLPRNRYAIEKCAQRPLLFPSGSEKRSRARSQRQLDLLSAQCRTSDLSL